MSNSRHNSTNVFLFSILIPTWNNLDYLKLCINSINNNSRYKHQIIIHVNEGVDGTLNWLRKQKIDFSYSRENIGICFALNTASSMAACPYIVYFNDDMYACPDWDHYLYEEIKKQKNEFFFLSSTIIEPTYSKNICTISPHNFGDSPSNFDEKKLLANFKSFNKKDWNGATWPPNLVPKKLWDLVGGYSIEFSPGMYSDPDFSMKLWRLGVRSFKGIGNSRVYHFMSTSTKKINKKTLNDGRSLFLKKWGMSSNMFTRYFLKRGQVWSGPLSNPTLNFILLTRIAISKIFNFLTLK
jgi:GT2 family glycosyltransferase